MSSIETFLDNLDIFVSNKKFNSPYPDIITSKSKLQFIANSFKDRVEWVKQAFIVVYDGSNLDKIEYDLAAHFGDSLTQQDIIIGMLICECGTDPNNGDDILYGESKILILDKSFQTVGVLLHELAHMKYPFNLHGEEFQAAHLQLITLWDSVISKYRFV